MTNPSVRLNVFRSHDDIVRRCGKVVVAASSLEGTLTAVSDSYGDTLVSLKTPRGAIVSDVSVLKDWDILIATTEETLPDSSLLGPQVNGGAHSYPPTPTPSHKSLTMSASSSKESAVADFFLRKTSTAPSPDAGSRGDWVRLNVGGRVFATTRATLSADPNSMLARMFESSERWLSATDSTGAFLIDRSPTYFEPLLNYLRHGKLILNDGVNPLGVLEEAKFFGISKAIDPLEALVRGAEQSATGHVTRKEFIHFLAVTSSSSTLRCQGLNLENVDLSNLDLRNINFKCANLRRCNLSGCDLSNCNFERADLFQANLDNAVVQCVHMPRVNLEGATLRDCSMGERMGVQTNLEGANLKGALFDNSQMNGSNLRLASLKGACLRSCNLRYAIMAGTDLENCDLTGCDLQHANLRGSNLAGVVFKNMIAPLHMSQTVNVNVSATVAAVAPGNLDDQQQT